MSLLCRGLEKNGMASVNQTRPRCINQTGKTHSKLLAAGERHAMCESTLSHPSRQLSKLQILKSLHCNYIEPIYCSGPGSSVGVATDYGLGGQEIESRWERVFPRLSRRPGAHPASCTMGTGSFPGSKVRPGRAADHSPSSAEVMEE
jgi:hypothetical protein